MRIKLSLLLAVPLLALALSGCDNKPHSKHTKHEHVTVNEKTVKVERLHDGRYAYYDDGFWWYYVILMNSQNSSTNTTSSAWTSSNGRVSLPAGGSWSKSTTAPTKEEIAEEQEATVEENANGEPMTEAEVQQAEQANAEADAAAATEGTEATTTTEGPESGTTDTAPADTGGGDAGGGGGDGGGGGGDGGGGGGDGGGGGE